MIPDSMRPKGVSPILNLAVDLWLAGQNLLRPNPQARGYLAACALFRDEAPYLEEWIEYHRLVGVEHFFLYNHKSSDAFRKVLTPYVRGGLVTLRDLSFPNPWERWQVKAYSDARERSIGRFKWLAAIDTDEFLCPVKDSSIIPILEELESHAAVFVHWKMFGTNRKPTLAPGEIQTEVFTRCAEDDFPDHVLGKTIAQPDKIVRFKIHEAVLNGGETSAQANGAPVGACRDYSVLQLNHYWTRAQDYFDRRKKARRKIAESNDGSRGRSDEEITRFAEALDAKEDLTIQKFVPVLKARLASCKSASL